MIGTPGTPRSDSQERSLSGAGRPKQWWAPVWTGLVMDAEAKHYRQMKNAVWLYLYFLLTANRKTGWLVRKIDTISDDMGVPRDTIVRWLSELRAHDYVTTRNTGRCLHVQVSRWKGVSGKAHLPHQSRCESDICSGKNPTSDRSMQPSMAVHLAAYQARSGLPNDRTIKTNRLTSDGDGDKPFATGALKDWQPKTCEERLAYKLARALDDIDGLALYLAYARRYPESVLRAVLAQVKEVPVERITKSYAALFNHLIQKYDPKNQKDIGR